MWINLDVEKRHKTQTLEMLIRMPRSSKEFDLVLSMDNEHLVRNLQKIDKLRLDTLIEFTGYIHHLGRTPDNY
jgi:hypothetical protein